MRGRSELRQRWRYWLIVALLVGLTSGLLIGAAAGTRRTSTVYDRLLAGANAPDVAVVACPADLDQESCGADPGSSNEVVVSDGTARRLGIPPIGRRDPAPAS